MLSTGYDQQCITTATKYGGTTDVTHLLSVLWYSFSQPQKDDRLSQLHLVLIQELTGLELSTLSSEADHPNH